MLTGNVIVSADYSQLELRILAHFSEDPDLLRSFQNEADVFVSIAAKWNNIPLTEVRAVLNQHKAYHMNENFRNMKVKKKVKLEDIRTCPN